jgi:long-subunit acyl-CoA synthetase (AMP-forming)
MVAICAKNCVNWFIADYATIFYNFISVPLHTYFGMFFFVSMFGMVAI